MRRNVQLAGITDDEWLALRLISMTRKQSVGDLIVQAIKRDRTTKQAFTQTKEDGK